MIENYYVYILGNERPTLYVGMTNDLIRRVYEHKEGLIKGFTKKYSLKDLLYFEMLFSPAEAITREKQLKHWNRAWKLELTEQVNPEWKDLSSTIV